LWGIFLFELSAVFIWLFNILGGFQLISRYDGKTLSVPTKQCFRVSTKQWKIISHYYMRFDSCTTPIQQLHNNPSHEGGPQYIGLIRDLILVQHQYNNSSHEGGPQYVLPTLMWVIVVQLLYWCCKSNIFLIILTIFISWLYK